MGNMLGTQNTSYLSDDSSGDEYVAPSYTKSHGTKNKLYHTSASTKTKKEKEISYKSFLKEDSDDFASSPVDQRKIKTTKLVVQILDEMKYAKDMITKGTLMKALYHIISEFSDIDWNDVGVQNDDGTISTISTALVRTGSSETVKMFLDLEFIDPIKKDISGTCLQDLIMDASPRTECEQEIVNAINAAVIKKQADKIKEYESIIKTN